MLSACWLIGAYFLAVSSHKRGRLNTSVYGSEPSSEALHAIEWTPPTALVQYATTTTPVPISPVTTTPPTTVLS